VRRSRERRLEAYRDGMLGPRERESVEHLLERDEECAHYLERSSKLGSMIRDAWTEGPPAPSSERFLAAIAPEIRRIDIERATPRHRFSSTLRRLGRTLRASWVPAGFATAAAAAALVMAIGAPDQSSSLQSAAAPSAAVAPTLVASADAAAPVDPSWSSAVYDLAPEEAPLMIYENDGSVVILVGENNSTDPGDISSVAWAERQA